MNIEKGLYISSYGKKVKMFSEVLVYSINKGPVKRAILTYDDEGNYISYLCNDFKKDFTLLVSDVASC